ncbi:MAG TPA: baseplate J/gp47 family protein [Pyrinomonadaceae bacterium]|nr:baseplate J/gp47 family protein [Pyrinomonadaceae bacterium]
MPITLPNLDDRRYADLVEEARSLIPTYAPEWTDHNESDPGITLIELFAYLAEMLLYRLNRVTDANRAAFLKLLDPGLNLAGGVNLEEQVRATVLALREPYRAVTCADFEKLALAASELPRPPAAEAAEPPAPDFVGRAHCVPRRNLEIQGEAERGEELPNHVSVIIIPRGGGDRPQPSQALVNLVAAYLDARRLVTTIVHVVGPRYVAVRVRLTVVLTPDALASRRPEVRAQLEGTVRAFFDPLTGGPGGKGWPLGRNVYVSELYEILDRQRTVDYVRRTEVSAGGGGKRRLEELATAPPDEGRLRRNADGDLVAVEVRADELVDVRPEIRFPEDE